MNETSTLADMRDRAEFWASRDPDTGLYDPHAIAFAKEVVQLIEQRPKRLRCLLRIHRWWRVTNYPGGDDYGYPIRTPLRCTECGTYMRCGLCGDRHA